MKSRWVIIALLLFQSIATISIKLKPIYLVHERVDIGLVKTGFRGGEGTMFVEDRWHLTEEPDTIPYGYTCSESQYDAWVKAGKPKVKSDFDKFTDGEIASYVERFKGTYLVTHWRKEYARRGLPSLQGANN